MRDKCCLASLASMHRKPLFVWHLVSGKRTLHLAIKQSGLKRRHGFTFLGFVEVLGLQPSLISTLKNRPDAVLQLWNQLGRWSPLAFDRSSPHGQILESSFMFQERFSRAARDKDLQVCFVLTSIMTSSSPVRPACHVLGPKKKPKTYIHDINLLMHGSYTTSTAITWHV